ncbi:ATP-binding cassette domain-containing protein [Sphingomonas qomolangmaensis]|uniref:ABC transporter ATP-binding protein n=1 Tax=Sphingomonas qomolangmaensis TaxID=2918765 RepID=A0ABY5L880_9SPHN|nr:ABC transporter ATP-binding protein [Sphingomonas qomolangmaensis]UUL83180.1 ABC transporter ATP-binding protein [Sphingomonas qomolangmaensis]
MLDQHVDPLDEADTIVGSLAACARFAFRNRDTQRIVGSLSGGERLRTGLAATLSGPQPAWLLILDEPTNHLDVSSIEVLERALLSFDGALLVVSHDVRFLEAIGIERTVVIATDYLQPGGYSLRFASSPISAILSEGGMFAAFPFWCVPVG